MTIRTFYAEMTNPARCAKGGAPPRRADAETNAEDCVRTRWLVVAQKYRVGDCIAAEFRFDFSARGPRPIERVSRTAGGGWWLVWLEHMASSDFARGFIGNC